MLKLAGGDDPLADEDPVLADRTVFADVVAFVADDGIRIEPRLEQLAPSGLNPRGGLRKRGVVHRGDLFQFGQRQARLR